MLNFALAATMCTVGFASAQEKKEEPKAEKIDLAARQRSLPILEGHIKEREGRMAETIEDMKRLDARVESKIDRIVAKVSSVKDSKQSGYRMSMVKLKVIEGLKKTIETYGNKRSELITKAREGQTGIPLEVFEDDAKKFSARIEKRVEQILEISKSYTQDKDVEKYRETSGGGYSWGGGWGSNQEINPAYRQNRRDHNMNKKQRKEVVDALKKAIERSESRLSDLDVFLGRKLSETDRLLLESEKKHTADVLVQREEQLGEMMNVGQPNTSAVTRDEAQDMRNALDDAGADLRHDMETIFLKYSELNRERSKAYKAKANLEARKVWIADYIKECEKNGVEP
jgi:hypothetical protein